MVFQPGDPKPPHSGRKKGTPNKRNAVVNDKLTEMVLARIDHLARYLDRMNESGPSTEAANMLLKMVNLTLSKGPVFASLAATDDEDDHEPDA